MAKTNLEKLLARLLEISGDDRAMGAHQFAEDPDLRAIVKRGSPFDPRKAGIIRQPMVDANCHWNVAKLYKAGRIDTIVVGYAKNQYGWHQHTWGLKNGALVETTASNFQNSMWYGAEMSKTEASAFVKLTADNPAGQGMIRTKKGGSVLAKRSNPPAVVQPANPTPQQTGVTDPDGPPSAKPRTRLRKKAKPRASVSIRQLPKGIITANEAFFDALVRHQIGLFRLSGSIRDEIHKILDATEKDIAKKIRRGLARNRGLTTPADVKRLNTLLKSIKATRLKSLNQVTSVWLKELQDLAKAEPKFIDGALKTTSPVVLETVLPSTNLLKSIATTHPFQGKTLKGWAKQFTTNDLRRMEEQIKIGLVQGESSPAIARRIVGTKALRGRNGIFEVSRREAMGITRTAVNAVSNQAKREFYRSNATMFTKELFVATLDARTCWSPDAIVTMADGSQKVIGDIQVGDTVLGGLTGEPQIVQGVHKDLVSSSVATYINGRYIGSTTNDHRLLTPNGWRTVKDLCLSPDVRERQVLCRLFEEPGGPVEEPCLSEKARTATVCHSEAWSPDAGHTPHSGDPRRGAGLGGQGDRRTEHVDTERVQSDGWGRGRGGRDQAGPCTLGQEVGQGIQEEHNPGAAFAKGQSGPSGLDGQVNGADESGQDVALEAEAHRGGKGSSKGSEEQSDVQGDEGTVARPGVPSPSGSGASQARSAQADGNQWSQGCGGTHRSWEEEEGIRLPEIGQREMVQTASIRGHELDREVEIVSLTIEGDPTYVVGGVIVHNTPICSSLDGLTFPIAEGPVPPLHFMCRSLRVAVLDQDVLGRRPAREFTQKQLVREFVRENKLPKATSRKALPRGQLGKFDTFSRARIRELTGTVPAKVSYQQWLGRQSATFQDDVLGSTRGRLFRRGEVKLDRFVNRAGDSIPLSELARLERKAFFSAGLNPEDFL